MPIDTRRLRFMNKGGVIALGEERIYSSKTKSERGHQKLSAERKYRPHNRHLHVRTTITQIHPTEVSNLDSMQSPVLYK